MEAAEKKPFKALLLDERDVLRAVVDVADASELTPLHVDLRPHGGQCDRKPGEYRWDRKKLCLLPLPKQQRAVQGRPTLEHAVAFMLLKKAMLPSPAADLGHADSVELDWLDDMVQSVDFGAYLEVPLVKEYRQLRGLNKKGA